jgi:hypothetical protein
MYSRTSHVRIYNKGLKHSKVEDVFSQEDIVSGGDKYERISLGLF